METIHGGHNRDLLFDATGQLVEVEEQIAVDAAPSAVRIAVVPAAGQRSGTAAAAVLGSRENLDSPR